MKNYIEESKRIKIELNKINDRSNQICRILDKDDIDVNFINKIGKKKFPKTPNRNKNIFPNLIYCQGKINTDENKKKEKILYNKKKKNLILNDFHSNYFKILKGTDNDKIIRTFFYSENLGNNKYENEIKNKKAKEKKLKLIAPEIIKKKEILMERLPLNYKKYKKNFEYKNNQMILDEINEKRYEKYDEPFKYSLNIFPERDILPKYNNLFFKYEKNKIRDYFYRKTLDKFHSKKKSNNKENKFQICSYEIL
jgi:hypothetical protein